MSNRIVIDPVTRLEGHGRIEILLNDAGEVANAFFVVPELRGFEAFCVGRPAEEMPVITNRICGICPEAHHIASTKTLDALYAVIPPSAAVLLRELLYMAFVVADHTTHFYVLGGPDLLVGPDAPPMERNLMGVIAKLGQEAGRAVLDCRRRNHHAIEILGGRAIHPCAGLPGGWSKALSKPERRELARISADNVAFALASLEIFEQQVLSSSEYRAALESDLFVQKTWSMGLVDARNRLTFYDGQLRVVGEDGNELLCFSPADYAEHLAERRESWTYLKFPYLKKIGWQGLVDGPASGIYAVGPQARLNVSDCLATPKAGEFFEKYFETLGSKRVNGRYQPVHNRMATHWARLVEMLYAAERMVELTSDERIVDPLVRVVPTATPKEGVGCVEAPRGTLIHHYHTDERGILTRVNLIVGTTHNHAPISMSVKKAAVGLIRKGTVVSEGLLNRIEMAFRLYDPCFACATHALPGRMPLVVTVRASSGEIVFCQKRDG